jgi:hypothetical protein
MCDSPAAAWICLVAATVVPGTVPLWARARSETANDQRSLRGAPTTSPTTVPLEDKLIPQQGGQRKTGRSTKTHP